MDGFGEKVYAFAPLLPSIKSKSKSDTEDKNKKHQKNKIQAPSTNNNVNRDLKHFFCSRSKKMGTNVNFIDFS